MSSLRTKNAQLLLMGVPVQSYNLSTLEVKIPKKPACLTDVEWHRLMYLCEPRLSPELHNSKAPKHQMTQVQMRMVCIQDELHITLMESKPITTPLNPIAIRLRQIVAISEELAKLLLQCQTSITMPVTVDLPYPSEDTQEKLQSLVVHSLEFINIKLQKYNYCRTETDLARLLYSIRHSYEARLADQIS